MFHHYLTAAFAKFAKSPFTTAANVLTLALGLACFIAAYGIATYWRSADTHHQNADSIYVVSKSLVLRGDDSSVLPSGQTSGVLARYLREDFPEIQPIARASDGAELSVAAGESRLTLTVAAADPEFLQLFAFDFVSGDPAAALANPFGAVITEDAASRLFGDTPAVGQTIRLAGAQERTVTGVIAPVRQPSFMGAHSDAVMQFDMLIDWGTSYYASWAENDDAWPSFVTYTFVSLPSQQARTAFEARLPEFVERRVPAELRDAADLTFTTFPVRELTTRSLDTLLFEQSGARLSAAVLLLALGALTLLVACVNYASLATAQGVGRAREVGMRKALGAGRVQVLTQSLLEAGILTLVAFAIAFVVLTFIAPVVRATSTVDLLFFLTAGGAPLAIVIAITAMVALAAGGYPALVLSRVRPAEALCAGRARGGPRFVAQLLVGVQFFSAGFLLILVTVAQLQRVELQNTALVPHTDPIVALTSTAPLNMDFDTFATRLVEEPSIKSVTRSDFTPWASSANVLEFARTPEEGANAPTAYVRHVDYDYFATLDLAILVGRAFERDRDTSPTILWRTDSTQTPPVVIDEVYARRLGFDTAEAALDAIIYVPSQSIARGGAPAQPLRVIGVADTDTMRLEAGEPAGYVYSYAASSFNQVPVVKIAREDVSGAIAAINRIWNEVVPDAPANPRFLDDLFEESFRTYARVSQIFVLLASTAFIIASIGQLGIAVHVVSRRRHEIGVRKVLGSTSLGVVRLLLIDFSKPALIANLLAWPLGYLAAQTYLSAFAHRIELTPAPFLISMAITLAIAWAAVIGEVLKAASVRPAEVLRHA
ncbi:MAG: ABC transporter permease [Maricaulaceae bacterium]|jgi:putative ABC transport system permease protein